MNEKSLVVNTAYLSYPEAGQKLGVTASAISHWINKMPDFKDRYVVSKFHNGRKRKVVTVEGLTVLANAKDTDRGGKYKNNEPSSRNLFKAGKIRIAEQAIQPKERPSLLALREMIDRAIEHEKLLDNHETRIADLEGDISKSAITTGQRKLLHEKINALHYGLKEKDINVPQSRIWQKVHEFTGRKTILEW